MSTDSRYREEKVSLSPVLSVVVTTALGDGVYMPPCDSFPAIGLDLPALGLLHELANEGPALPGGVVERVAGHYESDPRALWQVLDALDERGFLYSGQAPLSCEDHQAGRQTGVSVSSALMPDTGRLALRSPLVLEVAAGGFRVLDHDGETLLLLGPAELWFAALFREPRSADEALEKFHETGIALDRPGLVRLVSRLRDAGLLMRHNSSADANERISREHRVMSERSHAVLRNIRQAVKKHEIAEVRREQRTGKKRVRVVPVQHQRSVPPLALGMLFASARAFEDGRLQEYYHFTPDWDISRPRLQRIAPDDSVYFFSNYVWTHRDNLAASRLIKELNPNNLTVHGGPDVPKYARDVDAYFRKYPHVDVIVHGEGEITACHLLAALEGRFGNGFPDLSVLSDVAGLSFRLGDRIVTTAPRGQLRDLDSIPSPYLSGLFQPYESAAPVLAILETNRGCPYGCTFCDWGSATQSKVRQFSLERVYAELEWCARNKVSRIFVADANFGMLERDVQIAEKMAELKKKYGYPKGFDTNYAKNKVKYLNRIVEVMVEADVLTEGLLSLQSLDAHTLSVIQRSNIKTEKYDELAAQFRRSGLPLFVDIMLGLPGSTRESFASDLQQCVDREVTPKIFQTEVLVNSPMNEPAYRERYQIESAPVDAGGRMLEETPDGPTRELVVACSTFSRADYDQMLLLRRTFRILENFGVLRQVSRFVRQEAGEREIDFYASLYEHISRESAHWPALAFVLQTTPIIMTPPASWKCFIEEVGRLLVSHYGIADDSALRTVLDVQLALLPDKGRRFPQHLSLAHDYAAWHADMVQAKDLGQRDNWQDQVPRLQSYAPAEFIVSDPSRVCELALGFQSSSFDGYCDWELGSPVARVMPAQHLEYAETA